MIKTVLLYTSKNVTTPVQEHMRRWPKDTSSALQDWLETTGYVYTGSQYFTSLSHCIELMQAKTKELPLAVMIAKSWQQDHEISKLLSFCEKIHLVDFVECARNSYLWQYCQPDFCFNLKKKILIEILLELLLVMISGLNTGAIILTNRQTVIFPCKLEIFFAALVLGQCSVHTSMKKKKMLTEDCSCCPSFTSSKPKAKTEKVKMTFKIKSLLPPRKSPPWPFFSLMICSFGKEKYSICHSATPFQFHSILIHRHNTKSIAVRWSLYYALKCHMMYTRVFIQVVSSIMVMSGHETYHTAV